MKLTSLLAMALTILSPLASAHSKDPNKPWSVNLIVGYEDSVQAVPLGFLPPEQHTSQTGLALRHMDLSRQLLVREAELTGRVTLSAHGSEITLDEAFLGRTTGSWQFTLGQVMPDIGLLNQSHEHTWAMTDIPLVYRSLWGGQFSEATANAALVSRFGRWTTTNRLGIYSTEQFATQDASAALLFNNRVELTGDHISITLGADLYAAKLDRAGMNLFSTDPNQHSHGNNYTDEFSGDLSQANLMFSLNWDTGAGTLNFSSEMQWRESTGDLSSTQGQTLNATGEVDIQAYGGYSQLGWKGNNGLLLGLRQQMLGSDVELNNTASNDLDSSVLHNTEGTVNGTSWVLGYDFGDQFNTQIKLQGNQYDSWAEDESSLILTLQQGIVF